MDTLLHTSTTSETWEDHLFHLSDFLQRIHQAGLTVSPNKCSLVKKEVKYLCYILGDGVIKLQVGKVDAILNSPVPKTKRQVRSFPGLVGWYQHFVPEFSSAAVITDLIRNHMD